MQYTNSFRFLLNVQMVSSLHQGYDWDPQTVSNSKQDARKLWRIWRRGSKSWFALLSSLHAQGTQDQYAEMVELVWNTSLERESLKHCNVSPLFLVSLSKLSWFWETTWTAVPSGIWRCRDRLKLDLQASLRVKQEERLEISCVPTGWGGVQCKSSWNLRQASVIPDSKPSSFNQYFITFLFNILKWDLEKIQVT